MDIGDVHCASLASTGLALVALETGKLPEANEHLAQALNLAAKAGRPHGTLTTLHAGVLFMAKADKSGPAALLAYGVIYHVKRVGLGFSMKWHRDLDEAIARCGTLLEAEQLHQLEKQAVLMSIQELVDYALQALAELKAELGDSAAESPEPQAAGN
jgi:hypothetical protein